MLIHLSYSCGKPTRQTTWHCAIWVFYRTIMIGDLNHRQYPDRSVTCAGFFLRNPPPARTQENPETNFCTERNRPECIVAQRLVWGFVGAARPPHKLSMLFIHLCSHDWFGRSKFRVQVVASLRGGGGEQNRGRPAEGKWVRGEGELQRLHHRATGQIDLYSTAGGL